MVTTEQNQIINNYAALMEEVKQRIGWLNALLGVALPFPNPARQEFAFLQLRIICELIALGCLTAHGELPEAKGRRLWEEWNATNILKRLEHLHPDFYPKPITIIDLAPGRKHVDLITDGFLTKADLIALYARSGDLLHRGSVSKLLRPISPWPSDMTEITAWGNKITKLLSDHSIGHFGGQTHMLCKLVNPNDFGRVQVAFAEAIPEGQEVEMPPLPEKTVLPGLHPSKPWGRYKKK